MRRIPLVLLVLAVLVPATFAQKRPMTFEDMMAMKRLGETAVSPDGRWLAYSVTTVDLEKNTKTAEIWIQAISGGEPRKIEVTQPGDGGLQFSHDGKHILFLSSREMASQQVYVADFDADTGGTANPRRLSGIWGGADNARWAPDSQHILFTAAVYPDCPVIKIDDFATGDKCNMERDLALRDSKVKAQIFTALLYRHWNHFTGEKRSHLFLANVADNFVRDLTPNDAHDVPPFSMEGGCGCDISPDSKELAFTENPDPVPAISTSAQIWTLDLTNAAAKPVKVSTSAGGNFNPAYSPDGKYLAWRSQARAGYESDKFRLWLYDRTTKMEKDLLQNAETRMHAPIDFDLWVDEFVWIDDSKHLLFVSGSKGEATPYYVDIGGSLDRESRVSGEWSDIHVILQNGRERIIGAIMRVDQPSEVAMGDLVQMDDAARTIRVNTGVGRQPAPVPLYEPEMLTHINNALLNQLDLPKMESFWFTAKDGTKEQGFLIRPPNFDASKKYPLKFLIHGGPQGAWGDAWSYRWNAELFAANGYVVVMINPGGSTGYGQAFVDRVNGDWGGKPFTDLMTGLDYAEQHYPFIDKNRECALGASYGGYMANWILGHTNRFKCIVSHDGMFNAESAFGSTEEDWFNTWEFKGNPWDYYGKPDDQNPFRKWSPSLYAKNFKTPTLVVHSQLDYRLDVSEGFQLFDTLQLLGVPSKMLYFPDEGHWVLQPQNSQLWYKTVNAWVDQWTSTMK
jgi:dipeptidyl aminopeptidase/acylaminoacyl peptidase